MSPRDEVRAVMAWLTHVELVEVETEEHYEMGGFVYGLGPHPIGKVSATFRGTERRPGLLGVGVEVTNEARTAAKQAVRVVDVSACRDEDDVRVRIAVRIFAAAAGLPRGSALAPVLKEIADAGPGRTRNPGPASGEECHEPNHIHTTGEPYSGRA